MTSLSPATVSDLLYVPLTYTVPQFFSSVASAGVSAFSVSKL